MKPAVCSCGEAADHVVARRRTADGLHAHGWASGAVVVFASVETTPVRALAVVRSNADVWRALDAVEYVAGDEVAEEILGFDHRGRSRRVEVPSAPIEVEPAWLPFSIRERIVTAAQIQEGGGSVHVQGRGMVAVSSIDEALEVW